MRPESLWPGDRMAWLHALCAGLVAMLLSGLAVGSPGETASDGQPVGTDPADLWSRYLASGSGREPARAFPFEDCFREAAAENDLPLTLLLAVARGESDFEPRARSTANAHGLMQIRWPGTARHLGVKKLSDLYDPCINVEAGARYLRELTDRYQGNLHLALAAYNYGPSRIPLDGSAVPEGARWYSGYIYRHLAYVQGEAVSAGEKAPAYDREGQLLVIRFDRPYRAEALVRQLPRRHPGIRLDWFRQPQGGYRVVLLYADEAELSRGRTTLRLAGLPALAGVPR